MDIMTIAIHGGAGPDGDFIKAHKDDYLQSLRTIVQHGYDLLKAGKTALDAVTEVVVMLEDDYLFNAGKGAAINAAGAIKMDASIMDGRTQKAGAVVNQDSCKNSVRLARSVMEDTSYVSLTGEGLETLRAFKEWEKTPFEYFRTGHQEQLFMEHQQKGDENSLVEQFLGPRHGTVGAVAVDGHGNVAAATSTGGAEYCLPGRVSDSCVIGAGCYASNESCAVSGTGDGEFLINGVVAHKIAALVELGGLTVQEACDTVLKKYPSGTCDMGVISVDGAGNIGIAFNSERMHRAWIGKDGNTNCFIYKQ